MDCSFQVCDRSCNYPVLQSSFSDVPVVFVRTISLSVRLSVCLPVRLSLLQKACVYALLLSLG